MDERHLQRRGSPTGTSPSPAAEIASGTVTDWPGPLPPEAVLDHIGPGTDLVVPLANGDPASVLDAVEQAADHLDGVRVHQMHAIHERDCLDRRHGERLRHISSPRPSPTRSTSPSRV